MTKAATLYGHRGAALHGAMLKRPAVLPVVVLVGLGVAACASARSQEAKTAPSKLMDTAAMVRFPPVTFTMGFDQGEPDETPTHEVTLKAFRLDRTEVTNADYRECVDGNVCGTATSLSTAGLNGGRQPVVGVSWYDADKYCRWVGKRLPSEAEWERAVRGSAGRMYPFEGKWVAGICNVRGTADGFESTAPVGSLPKCVSADGPVLDLCGNASEWTNDWYDPNYYTKAESMTDPQGPTVASGEKVVRGGSYLDPEFVSRGTSRHRLELNQHSNSVGFRCAADE
jgi:sulfatase modifying factor 1